MVVGWWISRGIRSPRNNPVRSFNHTTVPLTNMSTRYLQNGNILAARTFISHFTTAIPKDPKSPHVSVGSTDEVILTKDSVVNFCQIAVLTCQRAQGDKNKVMRESWVRLCGTYQSQGGILATPEVRSVRVFIAGLAIFPNTLAKALNELATLYFAIPPPRGQAANPLNDLLSNLLGGGGSAPPARRVLAPANPGSTGLD